MEADLLSLIALHFLCLPCCQEEFWETPVLHNVLLGAPDPVVGWCFAAEIYGGSPSLNCAKK